MLARRLGVNLNASTTGLTIGNGDTTATGSGIATNGLGSTNAGRTGKLGVIISAESMLDEALEVCN